LPKPESLDALPEQYVLAIACASSRRLPRPLIGDKTWILVVAKSTGRLQQFQRKAKRFAFSRVVDLFDSPRLTYRCCSCFVARTISAIMERYLSHIVAITSIACTDFLLYWR
jgi:hypothetical protein